MPVKSVVDIEINDDAFKDFAKLFEKYQAALGATPAMWANAEKATAGTALNVESLVAALLTHEAINKKIAREEGEKARALEKQSRIAKGLVPIYRNVSASLRDVVGSLAKWASYTGVAGGIVGFGGLLGLDRLANLTGSGRRNAQGLGTTYGEAKAFENSYDRIVDSRAFLGGVNEALTDVTKRVSLFGAGLSNADINGKDTAAVANELLPALKKIADRTPDSQLAQVIAARGLGQFVTVEDLRRLKATSPAELASIRAGYGAKAAQFNVEDRIARKWQDLGVQLDAAKIKIEGVLVTGLQALAGPLANLSDHVANALAAFIKGIDPKTIDGIGEGIENFGKYLGSPAFRKDIKYFAEDVSYASKRIVSALRWLDLIPDRSPDAIKDNTAETNRRLNLFDKTTVFGGNRPTNFSDESLRNNSQDRPFRWWDPGSWMSDKGGLSAPGAIFGPNPSNPGNLRDSSGSFRRFADVETGLQQMAYQLRRYEFEKRWGGLDTIDKIVRTYAPASDHNNPGQYAAFVSKTTGISRNAHLDLNNIDVMAKIVSAMTKMENSKTRFTPEDIKRALTGGKVDKSHIAATTDKVARYIGGDKPKAAAATAAPASKPSTTSSPAAKASPAKVSIVIQNNTGGSAIVQSSQAAKQG